MQGPSDSLLLLARDHERVPVLNDGVPASAAARQQLTKDRPDHDYLWDDLASPDDLPRQRWGIIAPEGAAGDRLVAALGDLAAHRRALCQADADVIHRVPPAMDAAMSMRWYKRYFDPGSEFRDRIPRYLLILGDLDQVSVELQQIVGGAAFVGRLAFDTDDEYAAYADKLLRAEAAPASAPPGALLHSVDDGTEATSAGRRCLLVPGAELLTGAGIEVAGLDEAYGPDELRAAAGARRGGLLFTVSHGLGAPRRGWRSTAEQRARQGAMSLGEFGQLTGEELRSGPFLPGGLWFMLACFGAGTPATSAYAPWLELLASARPGREDPRVALQSLPPAGAPPFVAALPKAALANSDGPLGFISHVDLAWTYAFRETHDSAARGHPARFMSVLRALRGGARLGPAFRELYRHFEQTNTELSTLPPAREDTDQGERRGALWMLRQDLAGYVLLGDPAARLTGLGVGHPVAATAPTGTAPARTHGAARLRAPGDDLSAVFGFRPTVRAPRALPAALVEEAAARVILGDDPAKVAARLHADPKTLREAVDRYRRAGRTALDED